MMWVDSSGSQHGPKKNRKKKKIKERTGGINKRNTTEKRENKTQTKRIKIFYQSCILCSYTDYQGCYELWQLNDCDIDVG